jgi:adenylate kinase family enzyme
MRSLERVHIFGAPGCGSTTLGRALAQRLVCQHVDADDVYWLPTIPPYQIKRMAAERVRMLEEATRWAKHWVLSGAIVGWGDALIRTFDLVVFLNVPAGVRLARLRAREQERFRGNRSASDARLSLAAPCMNGIRPFFDGRLAMTRVPVGEHSRPTPAGWHSSVVPCFP